MERTRVHTSNYDLDRTNVKRRYGKEGRPTVKFDEVID